MQSLGLLFALSTGMAFAQATNSADITGTVTDATGAVIPGVTVTVTDVDKNVEHTYTTNAAGLYDTGPIVPEDNYTIVFKKDGFSSLQRGPMLLGIGRTGLNVQLNVGQTTQRVVVNESAPLLQTTSAEMSQTLPEQTLTTLPQTGTPDWQSFVVLQPGVSGAPQNGNSASNPGAGGAAANGSMPFSTAMLDGSSVSSPMSDNVINTPILDTVGEVKMSDSNFSAQYGTGGIIFNQISKGGTNQFHGLAYDYFQNTALNAASYGFGFGKVPAIHWNDFGFQVSGPVIKNRIFFLFDWDHTINHGGASVTTTTVPTAAMKMGDFTGLATIYDPTTQAVAGTTVTRQSFASEYGNGNVIPAGMIDPVAKNIQALFPSPTLPGTVNNFQYLTAPKSTLQKYFGRFDADITKNNHLSGSSAYNYTLNTGLSPVCPVGCFDIDVENMSGQITDVHTFSGRTINEAKAGWMGEYDLLDPQTRGAGWPAKLGLQFAKQDIFPTINISGGVYSLAPGTHANYKENVFNESDVVTMIRGRHSLHFGGEMIAYRADSTAWGNINAATLGFTGVYTQQGNTTGTTTGGSPYADFLLGYANSWSAGFSPEYGGRLKNPGIFAQDDWKLTPKLTVNLGLRWEGRTGWSDSTKNERTFDPSITNPATNTSGAMWYALTHMNGRTALQKSTWNNWLPRAGFAWEINQKTTLRGGFGLYTFPWNVDNYASSGLGNARSQSGSEKDSTTNINPVVLLSSDGNTNYQGAKGASINSLYVTAPTTPQAYNGQGVSYIPYDQSLPLLKNWNLTAQRQISGNTMIEVAYVGSRGTNLLFNTDLNQVPVSKLGPGDSIYRPYPQYQTINGFTTQGYSNYHALQAQYVRRMSNGLMFNFNYTWSHMLDNQDSSGWGSKEGTTVWQNAHDPDANYGAANFDIRHMFKAYGSYDLPFGHGRRYLSSNKALDEAVGGWTLSLTWLSQGGNPFTPVVTGGDNSYSQSGGGGYAWFPDQVGDPKSGDFKGIHGWYDTSAYRAPAAGTLGNMRRNSIYGPGVYVMNGAVHKSFPIRERVSFDFAANATNVLNHPSFAQPDINIGPGHSGQITGTTVGGRVLMLVGKLRF
ncbi:MAG TPA: TonB-dependent receptor [Acidobacteriaceae bacterium]|nr:TonB-dependent receptor [Acidobacteriaceae bacterium]